MKRISNLFLNKPTIEIAKNLLGCHLFCRTKSGFCSGKIIETEAYLQNDPASHSFNGKTKRNAPMFEKAGTIYVYFTYGMHYCFNVVTNKKGIGEAVLIRALIPEKGIDLMKKRRKIKEIHSLCNGPAKLVQALGIAKRYNGKTLSKKNGIWLEYRKEKPKIAASKRIGISKGAELPFRFYVKE